jgi:hypothetical protein
MTFIMLWRLPSLIQLLISNKIGGQTPFDMGVGYEFNFDSMMAVSALRSLE